MHELGHIRHRDGLSRAAARTACALFWFAPPVWIAWWYLCAEQELACDAEALGGGVNPSVYASCLVNAALCVAAPPALTGLLSPLWRRKVLGERIRRIAAAKPEAAPRRRVLAVWLLLLGALLLLGGARWREVLSSQQAYQRFVGRWVNEVYSGLDVLKPEALVIGPDRRMEGMVFEESTTANFDWAIRVHRTWSDARGDTYCQFSWQDVTVWARGNLWQQGVALMRVDRSGQLWEANLHWGSALAAYPTQIDPESMDHWNRYVAYRRQ